MVAVVGAGPAGSSAAQAIAASGMEVLLVDKKSEIGSPVQCGGFLPEAFELEKLMPRANLPRRRSGRFQSVIFCIALSCSASILLRETASSLPWPAGSWTGGHTIATLPPGLRAPEQEFCPRPAPALRKV